MKKNMKLFIWVLGIFLILSGCTKQKSETESIATDSVVLHYIDVGQSDATLIQGNDFNILIDAGNKADSQLMIDYLKANHIKKIDIAIATHAHEDHIGGFPSVLKEFTCDKFYISNKTSNSKIYESLLDTLEMKNVDTVIPNPGEKVEIGDVSVDFYGPLREYSNLNDSSIPLKITHGKNSFLFSGDAESGVEEELVKKWGNSLQCSVFQAGHHGSSTSNSESFMKVVNPETVIISSNRGDAPQYDHPHIETLNYLKNNKIGLYRTDKQGTIKIKSDGNAYTVLTEKEFSGDMYVK